MLVFPYLQNSGGIFRLRACTIVVTIIFFSINVCPYVSGSNGINNITPLG